MKVRPNLNDRLLLERAARDRKDESLTGQLLDRAEHLRRYPRFRSQPMLGIVGFLALAALISIYRGETGGAGAFLIVQLLFVAAIYWEGLQDEVAISEIDIELSQRSRLGSGGQHER